MSGKVPAFSLICEVDEHRRVLSSRSIKDAARLSLPDNGRALVNFDWHDDLGVPPDFRHVGVEFREWLASGDPRAAKCVDIGTWIVPLIAAGCFDTVFWVTRWANIRKQKFVAKVGLDAKGSPAIAGRAVPKVWRDK
jgi:hypothetical protein